MIHICQPFDPPKPTLHLAYDWEVFENRGTTYLSYIQDLLEDDHTRRLQFCEEMRT